jgi:lysophospholipase L1-like esterase
MLRRIVIPTLLMFFALLLCFAIGEVVLRFTLPERMFYRIDISSTGGNYKLSDNPKLIYVPVPHSGSFNSYGHRGPEFPFTESGKKRIVVMGDSVVEGLGVELGQRFTDIWDNYFHEQYEMINLGVCGYSLVQEFEYFKLLGEKFSPDYVFWFITFNDMRLHSGEIYTFNQKLKTASHSAFYKTYYKTRRGLDRFLMYFHTYKLVKYIYAGESEEVFNNNEEKTSTDEADNLLQQLIKLSRERNFRLMFIFLPVNTNYYESEINYFKCLIEKNNILHLDLRESFKTYPGLPSVDEYFLPKDSCHFSIAGHQAFADILRKSRAGLGL